MASGSGRTRHESAAIDPFWLAWLELYPLQEVWLDGRAGEVVAELDRQIGEIGSRSAREHEAYALIHEAREAMRSLRA